MPGLVLAALVYFCLLTYPSKSKYLTERQREIAVARMANESTNEGDTGVDKRALKRAFTDWKVYVVALMYGESIQVYSFRRSEADWRRLDECQFVIHWWLFAYHHSWSRV